MVEIEIVNMDKNIPQHSKRNKIYNKFYELFCNYNKSRDINLKLDDDNIKKMAINIERGIFNYTLNHYEKNDSHWNNIFSTYYINRSVIIYGNLNINSPIKNINLIKRLFDNEINEFELTNFTSKEMFPEKYEELTKLYNLDKIAIHVEKEIDDGIFKCRKCQSKKTTYYQLQTRSGDEAMTTYVKCTNCGNCWKFN